MRFQNVTLKLVLLLLFGLTGGCTGDGYDGDSYDGDSSLTEPEAAAIEVLEGHMAARNNIDSVGLAAYNNYPLYRIGIGGQVSFFETFEFYQLVQDISVFPNLQSDGWVRSDWGKFNIVHSNPGKVHIATEFSRVDLVGNIYLTAPTFWIVTNLDGHWGVKFKSSYAGDPNVSSDPTEAEVAAISTLESYMEARNNRDSEGMAATSNYPYIRLVGRSFQVWETPEQYIVHEENNVIPQLDYAGWHESSLEVLEIIHSNADKVHVSVKLSQFDVVGNRIRTVNALWIVTKKSEHWGIQGYSDFEDVDQQ